MSNIPFVVNLSSLVLHQHSFLLLIPSLLLHCAISLLFQPTETSLRAKTSAHREHWSICCFCINHEVYTRSYLIDTSHSHWFSRLLLTFRSSTWEVKYEPPLLYPQDSDFSLLDPTNKRRVMPLHRDSLGLKAPDCPPYKSKHQGSGKSRALWII
jgi:hypothetical protein